MAKIDLYSPQWVEMIFEGRNKEYGAYQLRKGIGKRNIWAIIIMLVAAVIIGSIIGINQIVEAQKAHEAYLAEMRASKLAEEQAKKEAQKKKDEPKPKVEEIKQEQVPKAPQLVARPRKVQRNVLTSTRRLHRPSFHLHHHHSR